MLNHLYIGQLCDLRVESKLFLASVPLVNHRWLRGAGEDEMRLSPNVKELNVGVSMPGMEGLVGIETVAVPPINASGARLGAVCYHKVPFAVQLEGLHKVGLPYPTGVNVLDLYKALRVLFPPVLAEMLSVHSQNFKQLDQKVR